MPAQQTAGKTVYYSENDTAPDLAVILEDGDGEAVDLTGATVVINIAYQRWSYYYSPYAKIVTASACVVDPDQVLNKGRITWTPGTGELSPAGQYAYTFLVTWFDGTKQTFPPNTYLPMIIKSNVGGNA
jgi:hypothetical protein